MISLTACICLTTSLLKIAGSSLITKCMVPIQGHVVQYPTERVVVNSRPHQNSSYCIIKSNYLVIRCNNRKEVNCPNNDDICVNIFKVINKSLIWNVHSQCLSYTKNYGLLNRGCSIGRASLNFFSCSCKSESNNTCNSYFTFDYSSFGSAIFGKNNNLLSIRWFFIISLILTSILTFSFILIVIGYYQFLKHIESVGGFFGRDCYDSTEYSLVKYIESTQKCNIVVIKGSFFKCDVIDQLAVKIYKKEYNARFQNELNIYRHLMDREGFEQFFPRLYTCPTELPELFNNSSFLAFPYFPMGDLQKYIKNNLISFNDLISISSDICRGLSFMHAQHSFNNFTPIIIHGDLKSRNVLVYKNQQRTISALLCDFDLSLCIDRSYTFSLKRKRCGTYRYMAPELLDGVIEHSLEGYKATDIYSLGLVLWELLSRCEEISVNNPYTKPYEHIVPNGTFEHMYNAIVNNDERPLMRPDWKTKNEKIKTFSFTIEECWDREPNSRISTSCVLTRLINICSHCNDSDCV